MAITNAQQYQQLVNPPLDGKRPGYRGDDANKAREARSREAKSSSKSKSSNTGYTGGGGGGKDMGADSPPSYLPPGYEYTEGKFKKDGIFSEDETAYVPPTKKEIDKIFEEKQKKKKFNVKDLFDKRKQAYNLARKLPGAAKSSYNNLIAYRDYLKSQGADLTTIDRLLEGVDEETPIGFDAFQELAYDYEPKGIEDIETLRSMFTDTTRGPFDKITAVPQTYSEFMLTQRNNPNLFVAGDLGNFMNMPKPKDLVNPNTGELYTNAEFEKLKRDIGQDRGLIEGMGGDPTRPDPCKGPNPPAYCNIDPPSDPNDPSTPSTGVFAGIAPRFAGSIFDFDKLRAGAMDGGIMNTDVMGGMADGNIDEAGRQMYFLGKLVKKATRAVKKVVKSPFGKAALGAALFNFGMPGGGGGTGIFSTLKKSLIGTLSGGDENIFEGGKFSGLANFLRDQYTSDGGKLKFGLGLGFGVPLALDLLGVGKDKDKGFDIDEYYRTGGINIADIRMNPYKYLSAANQGSLYAADGGLMRMGYQEGGDAEPVAKKTMPLIDMDGKEKDYRETGGFVDMGRMERADDVPARLSKNEFVFTADAVRNAGEGDIDKGAEVMYNMMKNLEAGGEVSEESQGLEGAREMFQTSKRLGEVI